MSDSPKIEVSLNLTAVEIAAWLADKRKDQEDSLISTLRSDYIEYIKVYTKLSVLRELEFEFAMHANSVGEK